MHKTNVFNRYTHSDGVGTGDVAGGAGVEQSQKEEDQAKVGFNLRSRSLLEVICHRRK